MPRLTVEHAGLLWELDYYEGCAATPPAYSHGGLPPEPPEIELVGARVVDPEAAAKALDAEPDEDPSWATPDRDTLDALFLEHHDRLLELADEDWHERE
jgi:hypothetical protein